MSEMRQENSQNNDGFTTTFFSALYCFMTYSYVYGQMKLGWMKDYPAHVYNILSLFRGASPWEGWMAAPHCLWHLTVLFLFEVCRIPMEAAAAFATCLYALFYYYVLYWVIRRFTDHIGQKVTALRGNVITFSFCFVQALYFYWLDTGGQYLGVFSPNPLHNPTQMGVRGFALLTFCLAVDLLSYENDRTYRPVFFHVERATRKRYILLAVLLFLSTLMKPTFAETFIPAVALFMLGTWISRLVRRDAPAWYFKKCLVMLLCALPSLLYMLTQFLAFFWFGGGYGSEGGLVFTKWLEVWKLFSDNVFLSILLGMAFPVYVLLLDARFFCKSTAGRLALISYGVAFLEAAILGEDGSRFSHGNFLWPLMSGMLLLWLTALLHLMTLEHTEGRTRLKQGLLHFGWFLFFCHLFCGLAFYRAEMLGL